MKLIIILTYVSTFIHRPNNQW